MQCKAVNNAFELKGTLLTIDTIVLWSICHDFACDQDEKGYKLLSPSLLSACPVPLHSLQIKLNCHIETAMWQVMRSHLSKRVAWLYYISFLTSALLAEIRGTRTCSCIPQGCIYSKKMTQHVIGTNKPHPLLTASLLLWSRLSQAFRAGAMQSKVPKPLSLHTFVRHPQHCIHEATGLHTLWMSLVSMHWSQKHQRHHCTALESTTEVVSK